MQMQTKHVMFQHIRFVQKSGNMTTYKVKKDKKNFRPIKAKFFAPLIKPKGFKLTANILPGGWSSKEEWKGDDDRKDWQKLLGVTRYFSWNDVNTAMGAFSFGDEVESYNIAAYTNRKKGDWTASNSILVESNELFTIDADFDDDQVFYNLLSEGNKGFETVHDLKQMRIARIIWPYAGGFDNSPGPYGGRAFKDMSIEVTKFEIKK